VVPAGGFDVGSDMSAWSESGWAMCFQRGAFGG